jgi:hypothetical protein
MPRHLTNDERTFLSSIFYSTLPYRSIVCDINDRNRGGEDNSITPMGNPYFSVHKMCPDFSKADSSKRWVFIHEMTHVWQHYHRISAVIGAISVWVKCKRNYQDGYPYRLADSKSLRSFNIEQQASIVADYWYMTQSIKPIYCKDPTPRLEDFQPYIDQVRSSGPPQLVNADPMFNPTPSDDSFR